MSSSSHNIHYRADIDGLRAIAVLVVVIFHAFPTLLPGGFVGVDVFFVISGFLISSIIFKALEAGRFSFNDFYLRRARRILPPLIFMVAAVLVLGWSILLPMEYAELAKHSLAGLGFVANIVLWLETGYFDTEAELKPLLHLWSLGVEEQFYIVWPLVLFFAWRVKRHLLLIISLIALLSFAVNIILTSTSPSAAYFMLHARAWELLIGALLAWASFNGQSLTLQSDHARNVISLAGLGLLAAGVVLVNQTRMFPGWWAFLPTAGTALLIAAGPGAFINRKLLSNRLLVFIGLLSFPLYLWHWPLLTLLRIVNGEATSTQSLILVLLLAGVLSWISYAFIETPFRRSRRWQPLTALISLGLVVALGSHNIYSRDGLGFRLKDAQAEAEARALEWPPSLVSSEGCEPESLAGVSVSCQVMSHTSKVNAVIMGDSHANHYYWALEAAFAGTDLNLLQLSRGGCPPLAGLNFMNKGVITPCSETTDAVLDYVLANPDIQTVFIAGRWMAHMTGRDIDDPADHVSRESIFVGTPSTNDGERRMEIFTDTLVDTLDRLVASGKRIVFLHAVPELPFNARECISWTPNRFVSRVPRASCDYDRRVTDIRSLEFRPQLNTVLELYPTLAQVDPEEFFCDTAVCRARQKNVLLYRDDDHLSLDGARWLGTEMAQSVRSVMGPTQAERPVAVNP